VEVNATMIYLERDYLVAIVRDITERQQVEDHLRQAQKMEAVGRLAGGVAHDFNNLLTVINCHTEFLLDKLGENPQLRENCLAIQYAGNRAAELTSQLLAFSRQTFIEPKVININEVVQSMRRLLVRFIREDITTSFQLDPEVVRFNADEGQIEQIIMNLVVNARDAMPEGGKLGFTTRNFILTEQDLATYPGLSVGAYACLEISDSGHGMSAETKDKIFEPFFTTKEVGKGTGLGLAVVHGVMQQFGGHVRVTSSPGAGTTFQLLFPATDLPQEHSVSLSENQKVSATESVLVVEDEDLVRRVVCIALKQAGFQVLKADSGAAAMAIIRDYEGPIDLVLTDVVMPEMSGRQLAEAIRAMKPGLRALFMSGHTEETMADLGLVETGDAFIAKPFTPASLIQKVREVLDRVQH
jgi:nitrogen-specific signal transduction histidine kinase